MQHTQSLSYDQARGNLDGNAAGRWAAVAPRPGEEVWPEPATSFTLSASDTIFTIGSCFARNIEDHLARLGCRVPMLDFRLPPDEWHGPANGALNKFAPPAFRQALAWTAGILDRDGRVTWEDCAPFALDCGEAGFYDVELAAVTPVARTRFLERRQHVYDVFAQAFAADCLMMTPGLVEAWRDVETGSYLFGGPKARQTVALAREGRFVFERLGYPQCFADLAESIDLVRARNPAVKVLLTTSPVPLAATFTTDDVRVANSYSKSVLRAVCGAMTLERPQVDYFPSYESATLSLGADVWEDDRIHVRIGFVGKIVARLLDCYFTDVDRFARLYQRASSELEAQAFDAAEASARAAVALEPSHRRARITLADALLGGRKGEEALAVLDGMETADDAAAIAMRRARAHQMCGRTDQALVEAIAACGQADVRVTDFGWCAKLLRKRGRDAEAEAVARQAIVAFPQKAAAHQPLIDLLAEAGRTDELIDLLEVAAELPLVKADNLVLLASLQADAGQADRARARARQALDRRPGDVAATALLERLGEAAGA